MSSPNYDLIGNRTFQALNNLYLNSKAIQEEDCVKDLRKRDQLAHAKEFGTIKLASARRSGHSTAIAKFINKHNDKTWVIMAPNLNCIQRNRELIVKYSNSPIIKNNQSFIQYKNGKIMFLSMNNFDTELRGMNTDGIIVDVACFLNKTKIEELYKVGLECMRFKPFVFFVFVG